MFFLFQINNMNHNTEPGRCIVLRIRVFEGILTRNVARFGSMSPYIEAIWNEENWKSKSSSGHLTPAWNECHVFEALDSAPLHIKIRHNGIFNQQEIGTAVISTEELLQGKTKEWVEICYEGASAGKLLLTVNMYEDKRYEQSTHNTSYASIDLKEEYSRKLNELELEKEELEFYKRKYKRKVEKLNQEKRNYRAKVSEIVRRTTPKHTEESSSEELCDIFQPAIVVIAPNEETVQEETILKREKVLLQQDKDALAQLKDQIELNLDRLCREKHKVSVSKRFLDPSHSKLSDLSRNIDIPRIQSVNKSTSEEKLSNFTYKIMSDWQEIEEIKNQLIKSKESSHDDELLELKLEMGNKLTSPRRATTPKSTDLSRANVKFRGSNYSTGKLCSLWLGN